MERRELLLELRKRTEFRGPIPSPSMLAEYNNVAPGLADRITRQAEEESAHRRSIEERLVAMQEEDLRAERAERRLGQWLGFGVCLATVLAGSYLVTHATNWAVQVFGGLLSASGLGSVIIAFMTGRKPAAGE